MGIKELGYKLTPPESDKPKESRGERWARERREAAAKKYMAAEMEKIVDQYNPFGNEEKEKK